MKKYIIAAATFVVANAIAGPFGLSQGMSLAEVQKQGPFALVPSEQFLYRTTTIANGHQDFKRYTAVITPETGLCRIRASGRDITTSVYGSELLRKHQELVDALTEKYGKPSNKFDYLKAGSIWKDPNDWMLALLRGERVLKWFWTDKEGSKLPDSLDGISVTAHALSQNEGYIELAYDFKNVTRCSELRATKKNANL